MLRLAWNSVRESTLPWQCRAHTQTSEGLAASEKWRKLLEGLFFEQTISLFASLGQPLQNFLRLKDRKLKDYRLQNQSYPQCHNCITTMTSKFVFCPRTKFAWNFLYPPHSGIPEFGGIYIITPLFCLFVGATSNIRQYLSARDVRGLVGKLVAVSIDSSLDSCTASLFSTETTPRRSASCITAALDHYRLERATV